MASRRNGGAAVAAALAAGGARTVFGIPGTHNLEIYRALGGSGIAHITPRHEQGAGFAADGYARTSGGPGVCITTSGPGLTNITTALATAYADSVPLLAIAPSVPRGQTGRDVGWLHEMRDQRLHLQGLLDVSVRAETADEATAVIADAFAGWSGGRPRPVYLEVPLDVLDGPWSGRLATATPPVA